MKTSSLAVALLLPLAVLAQSTPLLDISDPEGDDVGDGTLVFPRDSAFAPGDLDLRSLRVFADGRDLRFEATFRNPIRSPASARAPGLGSEDLSAFARRGFYAFNLDIYLDTDRVAGSGNTVTLPGRRASIDPAHAWEKAIVLTPRPELMKRQFADGLQEATPAVSPAEVEATIDRSVFFATDVRVRGRTVSFMVPGSFVSPQAVGNASVTAMVTLAKLSIESDLSLLRRSPEGSLERLALGAAQPEAGRPLWAMGYTGERPPATAVVDLLCPNPRLQATQLAAGALLSGLNRENQMGLLTAASAPATAPAVAAAGAAPAGGGSWFSRALDGVARAFGAGGAVAPAAAAAPAASLQSLMQPGAAAAPTAPVAPAAATTPAPAGGWGQLLTPAAAPTPAATGPAAVLPAAAAAAAAPRAAPVAPAPARDAAYFEEQELRLRTLKRLRDAGLLSEPEYLQKRKEVLDRL